MAYMAYMAYMATTIGFIKIQSCHNLIALVSVYSCGISSYEVSSCGWRKFSHVKEWMNKVSLFEWIKCVDREEESQFLFPLWYLLQYFLIIEIFQKYPKEIRECHSTPIILIIEISPCFHLLQKLQSFFHI